jgi:hypothetical protein
VGEAAKVAEVAAEVAGMGTDPCGPAQPSQLGLRARSGRARHGLGWARC